MTYILADFSCDIMYKKYSTEATSDAAVNTALPLILLNCR
jgi:hypothetical protein